MLAAHHGQNRPLGVPLRSDSAMTLMPLASTARPPGAVVVPVRPADVGGHGCLSSSAGGPRCDPPDAVHRWRGRRQRRRANSPQHRPQTGRGPLGGGHHLVGVDLLAGGLDDRHHRQRQHLEAGLARGDRLQHRRHAEDVGAEPLQRVRLGDRLVVRAAQHGVGALDQRGVGGPRDRRGGGRSRPR